MKIVNAKIVNCKIVVNTNEDGILTKMYIDTLANRANKLSKDDGKHTKVIENIQIVGKTFTITSEELNEPFYILTILDLNNLIIAIDDKFLYNSKVSLLTSYCSTCLDILQKDKIVMCDFKSHLLDYAILNDKVDDAISYYIDIMKITNTSVNLGIPVKCVRCTVCSNGCCGLC